MAHLQDLLPPHHSLAIKTRGETAVLIWVTQMAWFMHFKKGKFAEKQISIGNMLW